MLFCFKITYFLSLIPNGYFDNKFGIMNQIILPILFGALGCWIKLLVSSVTPVSSKPELKAQHRKDFLKKLSLVFIVVGALAGFIAVNLINPGGTFSQVTTLAFIAGLSGMTFLLRSSLVDGVIEDNIVTSAKEETISELEGTLNKLKEIKVGTSPEELADIIGEVYDVSSIEYDDEEDDTENPEDLIDSESVGAEDKDAQEK